MGFIKALINKIKQLIFPKKSMPVSSNQNITSKASIKGERTNEDFISAIKEKDRKTKMESIKVPTCDGNGLGINYDFKV